LLFVEEEPGREVHSGKRAIRLNGPYFLSPEIPAHTGDVFRVRFYAKGTGTARISLWLTGGEGNDNKRLGQAAQPVVPVTSTTWTLIEQVISTQDVSNIKRVTPRLEVSGDIYVDDLSLERIAVAPVGKATEFFPLAFAAWTEAPVTLDGKLDDECWRRALRNGPLRQTHDNGKVSEPFTFFQAAYDRQYLYLAIEAREPDAAKLALKNTAHDTWPSGGSIELFLDPLCSRSSYYQLAANPAGTRYDARGMDAKWDIDWKVAAQLSGDRWTMEVAIPFAGLDGGTPEPGTLWGLNLCRNREGGLAYASTWAPVGAIYHTPGRFNTLIFGTVREWWERQTGRVEKNAKTLQARLAAFTPRDTALEGKLTVIQRKLAALAPPADLSPFTPEFSAMYVKVQTLAEDLRSVELEAEMEAAIRPVRAKGQ
jgi:hypothetical protein